MTFASRLIVLGVVLALLLGAELALYIKAHNAGRHEVQALWDAQVKAADQQVFEVEKHQQKAATQIVTNVVANAAKEGVICHDTESLFDGHRVTRFRNNETVAMRKLAMLNRVIRVDELRIPPNNRLEALEGNRKGQWSIRINDQWRVCFRFSNGGALDVEIVDYH